MKNAEDNSPSDKVKPDRTEQDSLFQPLFAFSHDITHAWEISP